VTRPPAVFLTASWNHLVMLNYEVAPSLLASRVPAGTSLDFWNGKTYLSVVGFLFLETKVLGIPIPFHRDFEELNLRFYLRREDERGLQRGVGFIKELVPRWAIATVARVVYNENYVAIPMRHRLEPPAPIGPGTLVEYGWKLDGRWSSLSVRASGTAALTAASSLEEFITEHYFGYASQRDGGTVEYQVEHPKWRCFPVEQVVFDCDVAALYGPEFASTLREKPNSAFLADGSPIVVRRGVRLGR
jgi:uncharacterized protein YqjF (DUF2071 family)